MAKKTVAQLQEEARKAEQRAKELRAKAKKLTQAEEAKHNAEIIKAVREWRDSFPPEKRIDWADLAQYFRTNAERNRQRNGEQ